MPLTARCRRRHRPGRRSGAGVGAKPALVDLVHQKRQDQGAGRHERAPLAILLHAFVTQTHVAYVVPGTLSLVLGAVIPFLVWNWTVGFVVYLHHTHPDFVWYADKTSWMKEQGILHGTVRYEIRPHWNFLLHNIMEHAAHHLDAKIPLYRLKSAQTALAKMVPEIPEIELSMRTSCPLLVRARIESSPFIWPSLGLLDIV